MVCIPTSVTQIFYNIPRPSSIISTHIETHKMPTPTVREVRSNSRSKDWLWPTLMYYS